MLKANMGMKGTYELILNEGTEREKRVKQDNAILNNFFQHIQVWNNTWFNYFGTTARCIMVGSDATPVDVNQQTLVRVAAVFADSNPGSLPIVTNGVTWSHSIVFTGTFGVGQLNATLNEVGMNFFQTFSANSSVVHSRAVLNSPLVVTPEDQLTVKYTLTMTGSEADTIQNFVLNGSTHTVTMRRGNTQFLIRTLEQNKQISMRGGSAQLGVAGADPLGGDFISGGNTIIGLDTTNAGQRAIRLSLTTTEGNHPTGIRLISWGYMYKFYFDPPIPKDANSTLTLDLAFTIGRI